MAKDSIPLQGWNPYLLSINHKLLATSTCFNYNKYNCNMNSGWKFSLITVLVLLFGKAFASESDSLIQVIRSDLSKHEAALMIKNANRLLTIAETGNDKSNQVEALKFLGIANHLEAKDDTAISFYNRAIEISLANNDSLNTGKLYLNIATSYNSKGNFEQAIENALKSESLFEALNDPNGQARVQNLIGIFYFNREDFDKALSYFKKYNQLAVESRDTGEIVSSMNNMSSALHKLNEYGKEQQLLEKSIAIQEAQGQEIRIGSAYENLGSLYLDTDSLTKAQYYYNKARKAYEFNDDKRSLARLLTNTGLVKKKLKKYNDALNDYKQSLAYSQQGGFLKMEETVLNKIALLYEDKGDFEKAYYNYIDYVTIKDSILNEENQSSINELMIQFDTEKKERQIANQELVIAKKTIENRRKSFIIAILTAIIIILLLFSFIIYTRIKIRQERRMNEERMQMKQVQMKVVLESQEKERKRFARDLHDGFGQMITAMKLKITQLQSSSDQTELNGLAKESNNLLDTMHQQLREIAHNLMPEPLVNEGLTVALKDYAARISENNQIEIEVSAFDLDRRLDQSIEVNLYRIIQEWINNVIKYSGAKKLSIQLTGYENEINLIIEDNGLGFEKEKLTQSSGWGWKNIQSRLEAINGALEIDTQPGSYGTSFILDLPIA